MADSTSDEFYQKGRIIFQEGSSGDTVYRIKSGSVEISRVIGEDKFVVELLRQGDIFGNIGRLGGVNRVSTARALGNTTLDLIDGDRIDREIRKLSSDCQSILSALSERDRKLITTKFELSARNNPRIQKRLALTYKVGQYVIKEYTINISSGGLLIRTESPLKQGETFSLDLHLPGLSEPMNIKSEVAWLEQGDKGPYLMGAKFLELTEDNKKVLKQYSDAVWLLSK